MDKTGMKVQRTAVSYLQAKGHHVWDEDEDFLYSFDSDGDLHVTGWFWTIDEDEFQWTDPIMERSTYEDALLTFIRKQVPKDGFDFRIFFDEVRFLVYDDGRALLRYCENVSWS